MKKTKLTAVLSIVLSVMMLLGITLSVTPVMAETTVSAAVVGETVTADVASGLAGMAEDGWKHYYHESTYWNYVSAMTEQPADASMWYVNTIGDQKVLSRSMDKCITNATKMPWGNISQIVYTGKTFKNFEINATVYYSQHSAGNNTPLYIGFGKKDLGLSLFNYQGGFKGGMGIAIGDGGNVALVAQYNGTNNTNANLLSYTTSQTIADDTLYNVKVVVLNGVASVYINNSLVVKYTLPNDTEGYVSLGGACANVSGYASFSVTELEIPDVVLDTSKQLSGLASDGWVHYYHYTPSNYWYYPSGMTAEESQSYWFKSSQNGINYLRRSDTTGQSNNSTNYNTYMPWSDISQITYTKETFKNVEINATIWYSQHSKSNGSTPLYIGFGKKSLNKSLFASDATGGMGIAIRDGGNVALVANYDATGQETANLLTYTTSQSVADDTFFNVKVKVLSGVATVYINDAQVAEYNLPNDTEGYVSFGGARANASGFAKFELYNLDNTITATGGVTVDKTHAVEGETVTVTVPDGKHLVAGSLRLSYGDVSYGIIDKADSTVAGEGTGKVYSFTMPDADVTVSAELKDTADVTAADSIATIASSVNDDLVALRFLTRINLEKDENDDRKLRIGEKLYYVKSVGTLILPEDMVDGELTVDSANVTNIPATGLYDETTSYIDIKGGLKNIKEANRERNFTARGYLIYVDENGEDQIVYADAQTISYRNAGGTK